MIATQTNRPTVFDLGPWPVLDAALWAVFFLSYLWPLAAALTFLILRRWISRWYRANHRDNETAH